MANTHDYGERSLHMHYEKRGKIEIVPTVPVKTSERSEERRVGKECRSRWSPYH